MKKYAIGFVAGIVVTLLAEYGLVQLVLLFRS
jgi:heme/copper-type cytochrome/quinol oxidase subunit 4